jgi:RNA polymerase sigma factor (TIGR02999 family)
MDFQIATIDSNGDLNDPSLVVIDRRALDSLFSTAYEELRRLASSVKRSDGNATLSPTTLVNEAWLKLSQTPSLGAISQIHFKRIAARAMRQVLVDAARRKNAFRRGGESMLITFDDSTATSVSGSDQLLALDEAMNELARINPRQAMMVETRFFGGLTVPEIAELLKVSEATVLRDWRVARAWLARELAK